MILFNLSRYCIGCVFFLFWIVSKYVILYFTPKLCTSAQIIQWSCSFLHWKQRPMIFVLSGICTRIHRLSLSIVAIKKMHQFDDSNSFPWLLHDHELCYTIWKALNYLVVICALRYIIFTILFYLSPRPRTFRFTKV